MKHFDLNRFGWQLKWDLVSDWKRLVAMFFGAFLSCFGVMVGCSLMSGMDFDQTGMDRELARMLSQQALEEMAGFCALFFFIYLFYCASSLFAQLKTKTGRIDALSQPTTHTEKFLSRLLIATIGATVIFACGIIVADGLHKLVQPLIEGIQVGSVSAQFFDNFFVSPFEDTDSPHWLGNLLSLGAGLLFIHSIYVLSGTLFRRFQWVFASIITVMVWIFFLWLAYLYHTHRPSIGFIAYFDGGAFNYVFVPVATLLALFNYWLSLRVLRRMEVVQNKWISL